MDPGKALADLLPQGSGDGEKDRPAGNRGGEEVQHADGAAALKAGALGNVTDLRPAGISPGQLEADGPAVRDLSQDTAEERGFPGAVGSDEGGDLPAVELEADVLEDGTALQGDA